MRLQVVSVTKHFNGTEVERMDEIVEGESQRKPNRASARKLLAHRYPGKYIPMLDAYNEPFKWCALIERLTQTLWLYVYVNPLD